MKGVNVKELNERFIIIIIPKEDYEEIKRLSRKLKKPERETAQMCLKRGMRIIRQEVNALDLSYVPPVGY